MSKEESNNSPKELLQTFIYFYVKISNELINNEIDVKEANKQLNDIVMELIYETCANHLHKFMCESLKFKE